MEKNWKMNLGKLNFFVTIISLMIITLSFSNVYGGEDGIHHSKDLYLLGANTNIIFKPIQWNEAFLFLIGGMGLAYNNNSDDQRRVRDIGDSHIAGILQIGSGIQYYLGKGLWLRGEYRFHHISDPFQGDSGINTHNLLIGISF